MKKFFMLLLLCVSVISFSGCSSMTDSAAERQRRIGGIYQVGGMSLVDDWDIFWLQDRSTMLSQWHPHVGS